MDEQRFNRLRELTQAWVKAQEAMILQYGFPLRGGQLKDAEEAGVRDPARVRVLVVDRIPLPEDEELADAARRAQIITEASRGVTIGHGIIIRADSWQDRELFVHALVHVAQCERAGGLAKFADEYLHDRRTSPEFSVGTLEEEAQRRAREICRAPAPVSAS